MCEIIAIFLSDSIVCKEALKALKEKLGAEEFEKNVNVIWVKPEGLYKIDEEFGQIGGFPTFIIRSGRYVERILGGDPISIQKVVKSLEKCKKEKYQ